MKLSKLIFSTALIILNKIIFANCLDIGGILFKSIFVNDKLYYIKYGLFYVDLTGVSLDTDVVLDKSKWIDLANLKPRPSSNPLTRPILGGIANDKIIYFESNGDVYISIFDTTLNKWEEIDQDPRVFLKSFSTPDEFWYILSDWVSIEKTGKSYLLSVPEVSIFDSINLTLTQGPRYSPGPLLFISFFATVLLPNGRILCVGGENQPMNSMLSYDTTTDTWQMMNAVGDIPEDRTHHTAVSTSDGRVIVFGGVLNSAPALPHLSVLDTSKTPYEWSTPTVENPIGSLNYHTSVMVKDYMITAFGKNESEKGTANDGNNAIYKLDASDPSKYKWSLFAEYDKPTTTDSTPIQTDKSSPFVGSKIYTFIVMVVIVAASICVSILIFLTIRKYRNKSKNNYKQNISSDELEKNSTNVSSSDELGNNSTNVSSSDELGKNSTNVSSNDELGKNSTDVSSSDELGKNSTNVSSS